MKSAAFNARVPFLRNTFAIVAATMPALRSPLLAVRVESAERHPLRELRRVDLDLRPPDRHTQVTG